VLRRHVDEDGRIGELPTSRRPRAVILRWVASHLDTDRLYQERELRHVLLAFSGHPDSLRDALSEIGWLQHSGGVYRRVEEVDAL
jgi:hypothetical protein